jgi:hypothetical protein
VEACAAGAAGVHLAIRERRVIVTDAYADDPEFEDAATATSSSGRDPVHRLRAAHRRAVVLGTLAVF